MSRIGQKKITIPNGIDVNLTGNVLSVNGPKDQLSMTIHDQLDVRIETPHIYVTRKDDSQKSRALHGLDRSLIANMIQGVSSGYIKEMEIQGVGFKASVQGRNASFSIGFSNPLELMIPDGVDMKVKDNVNILISGADKQKVSNFAARVKSLSPVEPYKGKGIRFKGEIVKRKVGKTVA